MDSEELSKYIDEFIDRGGRSDSSNEADYHEKPVDITTFLTKKPYLGEATDHGDTIFPFWMDTLQEIFREENLTEVILSGGIGIGKSTCARYGVLYDVYRTLCLKDPCGHFQQDEIVFFLYSVTSSQTKAHLSQQIMEDMLASDWFRSQGEVNEATKRATLDLTHRGIRFTEGSSFKQGKGRAVGENIIAGIMDEFNEVRRRDENVVTDLWNTKIMEQYRAVRRRIVSRFLEDGSMPGKLWLISSTQTHNSALEQYLERRREDKQTYISRAGLPEVKREQYCSETVNISMGTATSLPEIVSDERAEELSNQGIEIVEMPAEDEFIRDFELDRIRFCQDTLGRQPAAERSHKLIPNPKVVDERADQNLPNLFTQDVVELGEMSENFNSLARYFQADQAINPKAARAIHGDLSTSNNSTGLAMGHLIQREDKQKGGSEIAVFDFIEEIKPAYNDQIPLYEIRDFILALIDQFPIVSVSFDRYQSTSIIQELNNQTSSRVQVQVQSTEKKGPYDLLRDRIMEGSIKYPPHPTAIRELKTLEDKGDKYDHPPNGSKDCADAMAGVVWALSEIDGSTPEQEAAELEEIIDRLNQNQDRPDPDPSVNERLTLDYAEKQMRENPKFRREIKRRKNRFRNDY